MALCLLGVVGVAQVTPSGNAASSAKAHNKPTSIDVKLKCVGDSGSFPAKPNPDYPITLTFTTPKNCPLQGLTFDGGTPPGFTDEGNYVYSYSGTPPIPQPAGYSFKYITGGAIGGGNGTGVIK